MELIQIVPALPPVYEGVGTYALRLAHELARLDPEIRHRFIVGDPAWRASGETVEGFAAAPVTARGADALTRVLPGTGDDRAVVLHYAGYAYQRRGCPEWLVDGLERAAAGGARLVTVFHEVWATGPPWRSSFWTHPFQRRLAARLARASRHGVTTLTTYAGLLARLAPELSMRVLPVSSHVGEPEAPSPPSERPPRLVVFGGPGNRAAVYRDHRDALLTACRALAVEEVLDLGFPGSEPPPDLPGLTVTPVGPLPGDEMSPWLLSCRAGFATYPPAFLPKSSVFAAYCAHGVAPVCPTPGDGSGEGLDAGQHYLRPADLEAVGPGGAGDTALDRADRVAAHALGWYRPHSWPRQAAAYRKLLR